jgi:hypothetical protein
VFHGCDPARTADGAAARVAALGGDYGRIDEITTRHELGAPYAGPVKLVMDGSPAPTGYEEVAIVSATGAGPASSLPEVLGALQREAASLGCDAVIRVRFDRGSESATATGVAVRLR